MQGNTLASLTPWSSSSARLCFFDRAVHYRSLNEGLRPKTRFFAAAAWINNLLGVLSTCRRLSHPAEALLFSLGGRLLVENNKLAKQIDAGIFNSPLEILDRQLVECEQYFVEEILQVQEKSNPYLRHAACEGIDALLNTVWLQMAPPLLPAPLCAIARLAKRQSLTFASRADREAIGLHIVRCME